MDVHKIM